MKKIKWILFIMLVFLLSSCYDDKGNYNYTDIDEITVAFPGSEIIKENIRYAELTGKMLEIIPDITYPHQDRLEYSWELLSRNGNIYLSRSKDLIVELKYDRSDIESIQWTIGKHPLRYSIKDTVTGQQAHFLVHVLVRPLDPIGLYLLHGDDQSSDLSIIENDDFLDVGGTNLYLNYWSETKGYTKIPGGGRSICWYYYWFTEVGSMFVMTDKGCFYLNPVTFTAEVSWEDLRGDVPETANLGRMLYYQGETMVRIFADGTYYDLDMSYVADLAEEEITFEAVNTDDYTDMVPGYFSADAGYSDGEYAYGGMLYSKGKSAFYSPYNGGPFDEDPSGKAQFDPNDMSGMQLIGMDYGQHVSYGIQHQWALFKTDSDGSVRAFRFRSPHWEDPGGLALFDINNVMASDTKNQALLDMKFFQMSPLTEGFAYVSTDSKVYFADIINQTEAEEIFSPESGAEKITGIRVLKYSYDEDNLGNISEKFKERLGRSLYISTYDGVKSYMYRLELDVEGARDSGVEPDRTEIEGKIQDFCFRLQ